MNPYLFITVSSILFFFINFYCYKRIKQNSLVSKFKKLIAFIFIFLYLFELMFFITLKSGELTGLLYKISIFCVGISFVLFMVLLPFDLALFGTRKFSKDRRKALKFIFDVSVLLGFFVYAFKGIFNANFNTVITKRDVEIKGLKEPLNIAIISDIHIGEFLQKEFLQGIVDKVNTLQADAVFIVGDIVDLSSDKLGDFLEPLNELKSKFGTYLVIGNHEYYHGIDTLIDKFKTLNLKLLENENVKFGGINLAGVYDLAGLKFGLYEPDFDKALSNLDPNLPTILLTHQPKSLNLLTKDVDLAICGHTHAGQIFPFSFFVWLDQKYVYGLYQISQKMQLLVSSGVGFWGPPLRLLSKSEIVNLTLKNKG
ncbi:metallophosphatase [Campylobacter iguaniorum]|uniref:Metallophosphatase n=2 Tax=Campylobacter iguaniorum TaxID=1244531 RepID=A0A076FC79_9BACT|nr:metallophosphoesterase [Campylobacter iguaniorum]AII15032.1 metallophosphatase [Campylobacter iguaniorum]